MGLAQTAETVLVPTVALEMAVQQQVVVADQLQQQLTPLVVVVALVIMAVVVDRPPTEQLLHVVDLAVAVDLAILIRQM